MINSLIGTEKKNDCCSLEKYLDNFATLLYIFYTRKINVESFHIFSSSNKLRIKILQVPHCKENQIVILNQFIITDQNNKIRSDWGVL